MCEKMPCSITDGPKSDDGEFDDYTDEELAEMAGDELINKLNEIAATNLKVLWDEEKGEWK